MKISQTLCITFFVMVFITIATIPTISQTLAWRNQFDDLGRIVKSIDPAGRVTSYSYTKSANGNPERIEMKPPQSSPVIWQYNSEGQLATMKDGAGEVVYDYDKSGRLTAIDRTETPTIRYDYDDADRIVELQVGDFYRVTYTYDFLGRIAAIGTPAGEILYEYQTGQGLVIRSLPNGVRTFWKRQVNGELQEITHGYFENPDDQTYALFAKYNYSHTPDGRISAIREQSVRGEHLYRYEYDSMGRLTRATDPGFREYSYEYDNVGNRVRATATGRSDQVCAYDWAGRLMSVDGNECRHDAAGNLTTIASATSKMDFLFDDACLLTNMNNNVFYKYDGNGTLIERQSGGERIHFINDPFSDFWQPLVMENNVKGRTLIIWDRNAPLIIIKDGEPEYVLTDHLGSARLIVDGSGNVLKTFDYDPFGLRENRMLGDDLIPGFAGLFFDPQTKLYLTKARAYNPQFGHFLQTEPQLQIPTGSQQELSLYAYCGNDPVNYVDLNGAFPFWLGGFVMWTYPFSHLNSIEIDYIGELTNIYGIGTNWGGKHRSGGVFSRTKDIFGEYPLGDPSVQPNSLRDKFYRRHDIQSFIDAHYKKDDIVNVGDKENPEYFISNGYSSSFLNTPNKQLYRDEIGYSIPIIRTIQTFSDYRGLRKLPSNYSESDVIILDRNNPANWTRELPGNESQYDLSQQYLKSQPISNQSETEWSKNRADRRRRSEYIIASSNSNYFGGGPPPPPPPPSPVGGVYLGGSGQLIEGLGAMKGVRIDDNGNLFLISEEQGDIKLPPLRLDDVVTIFRSVYLYGEGPTVTIDPNPEDPENSAMIIRHSEATDGTYVGWVLYQADRLMKSYTQGVDNITEEHITSRVQGYTDVVNTIYFGAGNPIESQQEGIWERFWIVPAESRRFEGARRELTLFDVPLKVQTQKMKWEEGQLIDDSTGVSSPGALAFTSWFTANYDSISAEQFLTPPPESGITHPVPVFSELRRIALMTAIAEKLRDQDVPMPFWMYDYEVQPVPFDKFTPGLEVTWRRTNGNIVETARIFGGVQLSADSKAVKTYTTTRDVATAPPTIQMELDRSIQLATKLEQAVTNVVSPHAEIPLTIRQFEIDDNEYQAVSVPGADTKELRPCRLDEIDMIVPGDGGSDLRLTRIYNSFFNPKGPWGNGWTLDLPRLVEIRVPVDRTNGSSAYTLGYELITPLNSQRARFLNKIPVLSFRNPKAPDMDANSLFQNMVEVKPEFFQNITTRLLVLKNGQEWYFTLHGDLVALKDGPQTTIYERSVNGDVSRIVSLTGGQPVGEIALEYDANRKLRKAIGKSLGTLQSRPTEITYSYDDAARLIGVTSDDGTLGYRYENSFISGITWQDQGSSRPPETLRSFTYNEQGQLLAEMAESLSIIHSVTRTPNGLIASTQIKPGNDEDFGSRSITQYDQRMRPVTTISPDGDSTLWTYPETGGVEMTIKTAAQTVKVIDSPDMKQRSVEKNGAPYITARYDNGGRLANLSKFGRNVLTQQWRQDGQLARVKTPAQGTSLQYDGQGMLSSVVLHPSDATQNTAEWKQTKVDRNRRPVEVTDYTGLHIRLNYDASGQPVSVVQQTPDGNYYGYTIKRDAQGRIDTVKSSWANTIYNYDGEGNLHEIVTTRGDKSSSVQLSDGRINAMTGFDNRETIFEYHQNGNVAGMPQSIQCANGLPLNYEYDTEGRMAAVKVGADRFVRLEYNSQGRMITYAWEPTKR